MRSPRTSVLACSAAGRWRRLRDVYSNIMLRPEAVNVSWNNAAIKKKWRTKLSPVSRLARAKRSLRRRLQAEQYNTVHYSTQQYNTIQYSTVQYSTSATDKCTYKRICCVSVGNSDDVISQGDDLDIAELFFLNTAKTELADLFSSHQIRVIWTQQYFWFGFNFLNRCSRGAFRRHVCRRQMTSAVVMQLVMVAIDESIAV